MEIIRIVENMLVKSKQKDWMELARKYKADELRIRNRGESLGDGLGDVATSYGYELIWNTLEDDIHVVGDGAGNKPDTYIVVDEPTYLDESIVKLGNAIKCLKEIEANRKKYYHKPVVVK